MVIGGVVHHGVVQQDRARLNERVRVSWGNGDGGFSCTARASGREARNWSTESMSISVLPSSFTARIKPRTTKPARARAGSDVTVDFEMLDWMVVNDPIAEGQSGRS
jgi:hypothetical protein